MPLCKVFVCFLQSLALNLGSKPAALLVDVNGKCVLCRKQGAYTYQILRPFLGQKSYESVLDISVWNPVNRVVIFFS